jgi:tRNA pseudouridine38-40 synthase
MDVPRAPGIGLLLERLHYERYDSRFKDTHSSLEDLGEEAESNILKIRNELIVSEILATECETQSMIIWLSTLPLHSFSTTHGESIEESQDTIAELIENPEEPIENLEAVVP